MSKPANRLTAIFIGHVQGVGFRFTTCDVAARFDVTGTVRNLPDGTVELVAEGDLDELNGLVAAIRERMQDFIRDVKIDVGEATGRWDAFSIQH